MAQLRIFERTYFSPGDEAAFFSWLKSIPGVKGLRGTPGGLLVDLVSKRLSNSALRELIALHYRFALPMKDLQQFKTARNAAWFEDPAAYWHAFVFGEQAVSANLDARLEELHLVGATPIEAIKTIRAEYGIPLGEAKRRFSISAPWQREVRANEPLQKLAIKAVRAAR